MLYSVENIEPTKKFRKLLLSFGVADPVNYRWLSDLDEPTYMGDPIYGRMTESELNATNAMLKNTRRGS